MVLLVGGAFSYERGTPIGCGVGCPVHIKLALHASVPLPTISIFHETGSISLLGRDIR